MRSDPWKAIFDARGRVDAYIDALWSGRLAAPAELKEIYTERLAVAAKLSALLRYLRSTADIHTLIRAENAQFPRTLLATDAGRAARAAFNLLARAVAALEEYQRPDTSIPTGPETLVGQQLSSVQFGMSHITLDFNGQFFHADCPIRIEVAGATLTSEDERFGHRLREAIGQVVRAVEIGEDAVVIALDRCRIDLLFGAAEPGPEALTFTSWDRGFHEFWPKAKAKP